MTFQTDQGYSWVVLVAVLMINVMYGTGPASVGIFLVEFFQHFQVSSTALTLLPGLYGSIGFIIGFPISWLCNVVGFRPVAIAAAILTPISFLASAFAPNITTLYVTYGFMSSVGQATLHNTGSMAVQHYFDKKRGFASGVIICGLSVGVFIWPPFIRWIIDLYGWRGAFIITAGGHLHSLAFVLLLRPIPPDQKVVNVQLQDVPQETEMPVYTNHKDQMEEGGTECLKKKSKLGQKDNGRERRGGAFSMMRSYFRLLVDYPLLVPHLIGAWAIQAGHCVPFNMIPLRAKSLNIDKTRAATLMSIFGIVSLCARVLLGYVGDMKYVHRGLFVGLSGLLAGTITALSTLFTNYTLMVIYIVLLAIMSAPYVVLLVSSAVDIVGVDNAEVAVGYISLSIGIAGITALPLSGLILDRLTDPKYTFLFFGSGEILGGLIVVFAASINIRWTRQKKQQIND